MAAVETKVEEAVDNAEDVDENEVIEEGGDAEKIAAAKKKKKKKKSKKPG